MTKSALVKIGVPSVQAESLKRYRQVRQILDQRDAAVARLDAATDARIREVLSVDETPAVEEPATTTDEPIAAAT